MVDGSQTTAPYTVFLIPGTPPMSDAPDSYNMVDINVGTNTNGFSIDDASIIQYTGNVDFKGFALCQVDGIAPYLSAGSQTQLLWKNNTSVAEAPNCANVDLKIVYV